MGFYEVLYLERSLFVYVYVFVSMCVCWCDDDDLNSDENFCRPNERDRENSIVRE
jgi:hypothetical protein